ncbi:L-threonylcarbamoyladenylate synthase [uncultured Microbacterium sp.]|jgi:tRNA threonylcarbamoyl adenosine modification protein (Sua5/YciO/YrdC/YwlC family)|uniref:L-threonylcarbamoyladenylate synthase n=1 Tax=uncultured Microbacterium sp. TaxID=191216 RepID=UPI0026396483|nr:L-threonylcarbamoyladenylate synthase [uncultured Microbacterium sp.]
MSTVFDCRDQDELLAGMRNARAAIARGELIVIPTDTVYGIAADAFSPAAVQRLLDAKGRGREMPPPVLVASQQMVAALVESIPDAVQKLIDAFWPGGLTIVLPAQPSLTWDLGETKGTVAVRMPDRRVALELLAETGPLAVSSANLTGRDAAIIASDAKRMLGDSVAVYLEEGYVERGIPSTIVDATSLVEAGEGQAPLVRILRDGVITREQLEEVLGDLLEPAEKPGDVEPDAGDAEAVSAEPGGDPVDQE